MAGERYDMAPERQAAGKAEVVANKAFVSGVDTAQTDFDKSLKNAQDVLALANKQGNKKAAADAKDLIEQLNTVVKPALEILQKSNSAGAAYTGDMTGINKALGTTGGVDNADAKAKAYKDAYDRIKSENPNWWDENVQRDAQKEVDEMFPSNNTSSGGSSGSSPAASGADKATSDAFSMLSALFTQYNLGSLSDTITRMMKMGLTAQEATVKLKYDTTIDSATGKAWNAAYTLRFAGNEKRKAAGLNAISEAEYLGLEDSYAETLRAYGLGNMLSTSRDANQAKFASYIGNDMSTVEFKDRIATVSERVINADPAIKAAFKQYYPNLTDQDLVQYFLSPTDTLPKLKEKATAAEIGGAALGQGLSSSKATSEDLARYGIDRAGAIQGYANIAEVLPTAQKLGDIYKESGIKYDQASGESEFMKNNQSDAAKRKRLKSMERAQFQGDSGINVQSNPFNKSLEGSY